MLLLLVILASLHGCLCRLNNVCEDLEGYNNILFSKDCYYNPDVDLRMPEIITRHGYPAEVHEVVTSDGYILTLFRIPGGRMSKEDNITIKQPVFFQHGFLLTSTFWLFSNDSYGYQFADRGYDVWLGNSRGSTYSTGHITLSPNDLQYWNFSYHEIGFYDVRSQLDYIYNKTGRSDIIFVAHSLGTNLGYVYASDLPMVAEKRLKLMVSLAPTLYFDEATSLLTLFSPYWRIIQFANKYLQIKALLPNTPLTKEILKILCLKSSLQVFICETILFLVFGIDYEYISVPGIPMFLAHYPAGTSINTVLQILQGIDTNRFSHFDYGTELNMKYYNSSTPPDYNISRVKIPAYILYSLNDILGTPQAAMRFYNNLTSQKTIERVEEEEYNHLDFIWAKNVREQVLTKLFKFLEVYKLDTIP